MSKSTAPDGWHRDTLGSLVDVLDSRRIPVSAEVRNKKPGSVPYYGANGQQGFIDGVIFDEPLILLAEDGGNFDEFASRAIAYRISGPSWVNNHAHVIRSVENVHQDFVFFALEHRDIRKYISGGTRTKLTQGELRSIEINVPPFTEQQGIAEILNNIDEAIRSTERILVKLEQAKQGLIHDILTRGIDESGQLRSPLTDSEGFMDSPLGRVPIEWSVGPMVRFITLQRGFDITVAEQRQGDIPVVSSSGISSFHDRAMVKGPGVVIGRKGKLGDSYYITSDFWPHDTSLWVKKFQGIVPKFAALLLWSMRLERFDAATSVPTLNRNFVHPILIAVPPIAEQRRILSAVDTASGVSQHERVTLAKLRLLKKGLMDDLLTGRARAGALG